MKTRRDGRSARWDQHRAERRAEVITTAVRLIAEGRDGANVAMLSAATPIPRSTIYRLFNSTAELEEAIRQGIVARLLDDIDLHVDHDDSIATFARRSVGAYTSWVATNPRLQIYMTGRTGSPSPGSPAVSNGRRQFVAVVADALRELLRRSAPDSTIDWIAARSASGIVALVESVVVDAYVERSEIADGAPHLVEFLSGALRGVVIAAGRARGVDLDVDASRGVPAG
ncbi:TetR/AcrR family transcriptional regulator [Tomitella cavernea]|nr:TetR/AcrR family transcriptional regulator [Tomitella cavernea]